MPDKNLFKKLSKMPVRKRIQAVSSNQEIAGALATLSPTDFAALFPKYYQRGLPDVSGFRAATTAAAQKKQSEAASGVVDRISQAGAQGQQYASDIYHKVKKKLGLEETPLPDLTKDQSYAWEKIKSGNVPTNSQDAKMLSGLTDSQLSSIGLSKTKDNTGREVFRYNEQQFSREDAERRLQTTGGANANVAQRIAWYREYAKSIGLDPNKVTGIALGEGAESKDKQPWKNWDKRGWSFGDFQLFTGGGVGNKFVRDHPDIPLDKSHWKEQGKYAIDEMKREGDHAWFSVRDADPLKQKDWERGRAAIIEKGKNWWTKRETTVTGGEKPQGPNGKYSDEQINKMMNQLREESNETRKQQLANLLTNAGVPTATINSLSDVQSSGVVGKHFGRGTECVALSKHFAPNIGPASKWTFHEGTSGIVPGAIIATTRYGNGDGGKHFYEMPDKKSHYHTGVALTRPDAKGDVLILDQSNGKGSAITKINIHEWHGEKWGAVKGGEPTEHSMTAVNIALARASDSEKAAIMESMRGVTPQTKTSTPEIRPQVESGSQPPVKPVDQEGKPLPSADVKGPKAPEQPAASAPPTAVVKPAGPQPVKYKFDEAAFEAAVRAKYGMLSSMYDRAGLVNEFKSKLPQGVSYDKGILTINDPNSPHIKSIRSDMEKEFGKESIDKMITQVKEAPPPPPPEKKVEAAPPPEKHAEVRTSPGEAQQPPPSAAPSPKLVSDMPTPVATAATGGSFDVPDGGIQAYPIGGLKNDNTVVVNKEQKPLFTMNSNEAASYNPSQGTVDITPTTKPDGNAFGPPQDNVRNEIQQLKQEMSSSFMDAGGRAQIPQMRPVMTERSDSSAYVSPSPQLGKTWQNAAFERAMNRTRMMESGDTLNNHFSSNNTNA